MTGDDKKIEEDKEEFFTTDIWGKSPGSHGWTLMEEYKRMVLAATGHDSY